MWPSTRKELREVSVSDVQQHNKVYFLLAPNVLSFLLLDVFIFSAQLLNI